MVIFGLLLAHCCAHSHSRSKRHHKRDRREDAVAAETAAASSEVAAKSVGECESQVYAGKPCHECCRKFQLTGLREPKTKRCFCVEPGDSVLMLEDPSIYRSETEEEKRACEQLDRTSFECVYCCMYRARFVQEHTEEQSGDKTCKCAEPFERFD